MIHVFPAELRRANRHSPLARMCVATLGASADDTWQLQELCFFRVTGTRTSTGSYLVVVKHNS